MHKTCFHNFLGGVAMAFCMVSSPILAGEIAITLDDAPTGDTALMTGAERTERIIAALAEVEVSEAMIFVMTGNIASEREAERVRAYAEAGHAVANHSHTHPWLRDSSPEDYLADIDQTMHVLSEIGVPIAPFFRFPYLDEGKNREDRLTVAAGLQVRGLQNGYVTVDNYDWYMQSLFKEALTAGHEVDIERLGEVYVDVLMEGIAFYDAIAQRELGRSPRHVLLLHENDLAALFLPDLVSALREAGWEIIPAQSAYEDPIAQMVPDTTFNGQGRVAAIAREQGAQPPELVSPMEEESVLREIFVANDLLPAAAISD